MHIVFLEQIACSNFIFVLWIECELYLNTKNSKTITPKDFSFVSNVQDFPAEIWSMSQNKGSYHTNEIRRKLFMTPSWYKVQ